MQGQIAVQTKLKQIADGVNGNCGVAAFCIEAGKMVSFNGNRQFPMESVYKWPIAIVMLHQVDEGKFSLDRVIKIDKSEYILKEGHSPIRDKYPNGASLSLKEVLRYNVTESDGTACDVMLRLLGGTENVQKSIHDLGVKQIAISVNL